MSNSSRVSKVALCDAVADGEALTSGGIGMSVLPRCGGCLELWQGRTVLGSCTATAMRCGHCNHTAMQQQQQQRSKQQHQQQ